MLLPRLSASTNMLSKSIVPLEANSNRMDQWSGLSLRPVFNRCSSRDILVERALFHDDVQVLLANDQVEIFEWIAIYQKQVGDVAFLHLAEFTAHAHHLAANACAALQRLVRREAQ